MEKIWGQGLTFDDVLLVPDYSEVLPEETSLKTRLTPQIELNIPLLSAAMDTVTEAEMAISMARSGGVGVVHKNMSIEEQSQEVERVKKSESGMIVDPVTVRPGDDVETVLRLMSEYRISGLPVEEEGRLVGIVTNRDVRFVSDLGTRVDQVMTSGDLVTVPVGTTLLEAKDILQKNKIEKLLVVEKGGGLKGLITIKDIEKIKKYPNACKDEMGRLRVGAAVGTGEDKMARVEALIKAGSDFIVLDSAHGHSRNIIQGIRDIKASYPDCQLIAGNVAT